MGCQHHGAPMKDISPTPTSEMAMEDKSWEEPHARATDRDEGVSQRQERQGVRKKLPHCSGGGVSRTASWLDFLNA